MRIIEGDCREAMAAMDECVFDACVTDPPYELGFMGKAWDARGVAFDPATWAAVLRVLKPGAHLLAFGGTRTFHRMAVAIEDAGFELRDTVMWMYGTGFPKSHDVAKAVHAQLVVGGSSPTARRKAEMGEHYTTGATYGRINEERAMERVRADKRPIAPAAMRPEAAPWDGWGTALKPAWEPIIVARKPLIGTVAANVLAHGTGALNIDGCRIDAPGVDLGRNNNARTDGTSYVVQRETMRVDNSGGLGRWPANVIHDGSDEVLDAFAAYGEKGGGPGGAIAYSQPDIRGDNFNRASERQLRAGMSYGDTGTAARFFYSAKAGKEDRAGSKHPTVKPIALMRYLCRLVTPPGGHILDPFAGSGTTLAAAFHEGFEATVIEQEAEHAADCRRRLLALQMAALPPALRDLIG